MCGFGAEGVAVDEREKWCQASLSVPGAVDMTSVVDVAILDSRRFLMPNPSCGGHVAPGEAQGG